jgi:hypothetical protein
VAIWPNHIGAIFFHRMPHRNQSRRPYFR